MRKHTRYRSTARRKLRTDLQEGETHERAPKKTHKGDDAKGAVIQKRRMTQTERTSKREAIQWERGYKKGREHNKWEICRGESTSSRRFKMRTKQEGSVTTRDVPADQVRQSKGRRQLMGPTQSGRQTRNVTQGQETTKSGSARECETATAEATQRRAQVGGRMQRRSREQRNNRKMPTQPTRQRKSASNKRGHHKLKARKQERPGGKRQ